MKTSDIANKKVLGVFTLVMLTIVSIDSVRNLPAMALFGSTLLFFFFLGAIFFLIPSALVAAELSSNSAEHGGIYVWIKKAFGPQLGVLAIWLQWVENVIWYPTILSFVAGTIGYLFSPELAKQSWFLITVILVSFWGATIVNLFGIKSSARFSNFCAISGLILPMTLIIILGIIWLTSDHPSQIHFTSASILPHHGQTGTWVALSGIILSFCGMEIATVHAQDVKNPRRDFPRALLIATIIIVLTLSCGSLAIALVVPEQQISLVAGIMQAFDAFFAAYHIQWVLPFIAVILVIGGMGSVSNWIIAPVRGVQIAANDGFLPGNFKTLNRYQAPSLLLIYQAIIVTFISLVFLLLPSVNASYWLLTALSAQLYMIMYVLMFAAGIYLRKHGSKNEFGFRIPGGKLGIWLIAGAGILGAIATFVIGFIPPENINIGNHVFYEALLIIGLVIMSAPPFILYKITRSRVKKSENPMIVKELLEVGNPD